jgi:hypothetical protein
MFEPDELAEMAEQLRHYGIDAWHEVVFGEHTFLEGLDIGEDFFPLWELILPENCEDFERRDFAAIKARRAADWSVEPPRKTCISGA